MLNKVPYSEYGFEGYVINSINCIWDEIKEQTEGGKKEVCKSNSHLLLFSWWLLMWHFASNSAVCFREAGQYSIVNISGYMQPSLLKRIITLHSAQHYSSRGFFICLFHFRLFISMVGLGPSSIFKHVHSSIHIGAERMHLEQGTSLSNWL